MNKNFMEKINILLIKLLYQEKDDKQRFLELRKLYNIELQIHEHDQAAAYCHMKHHIDHSLYTRFIDEIFPGFVKTKVKDPICNILGFGKGGILAHILENETIHWLIYILSKALKIWKLFFDLFKDSYFVILIIVVPALLSSLLLAIRDPAIVFGEKERKEESKNR